MNSLRGNLSILFDLYVDSNDKLNLKVGTSILEVGSIIKDTWHVVTVTFDTTSIKIYLDNNTVKLLSSTINLQDCLTYIGCQVSGNSCISHLIGKVSLVAFTPIVSTLQEINKLHTNGLLVNVKSYYDKLGRLESKVIRHDDKVLSKGYYYKETTETSNRILKEDYQGNVSEYSYDSVGNITSIQTINPTTNIITESKTYTYLDLLYNW